MRLSVADVFYFAVFRVEGEVRKEMCDGLKEGCGTCGHAVGCDGGVGETKTFAGA